MKAIKLNSNLIVKIASIVVYIAFITLNFQNGVYARYTSSISGVSSPGVAAKFSVAFEPINDNSIFEMNSLAGNNITYKFSLANYSEVPVKSQVELEFDKPLNDNLQVRIYKLSDPDVYFDIENIDEEKKVLSFSLLDMVNGDNVDYLLEIYAKDRLLLEDVVDYNIMMTATLVQID